MKKIILHTSEEHFVCNIPDNIYDNLFEYFDKYSSWAESYGSKLNLGKITVTVLDVEEFIEWLNNNILEDKKAEIVENIGIIDSDDINAIPEKYRDIEIRFL